MNANTQTTDETLVITRTFDAPRELVWKAYTEIDRLKQWWGPRGFKMIKATLDLRPGGIFHYGMSDPDGNEMWGKFTYREIDPIDRLVFTTSFSDPNGGTTRAPFAPDFPLETLSVVTFTEENGRTTITMEGSAYNATEAERTFFTGMFPSMRGGYKGTLDQLEAYLDEVRGTEYGVRG